MEHIDGLAGKPCETPLPLSATSVRWTISPSCTPEAGTAFPFTTYASRFAWNNVRYEGVTRRCEMHDSQAAQLHPLERATPELLTYDAAFFPDDRHRFVQHWTTQTASTGLTIRRDGRLAGYGVIRPCRVGYKVGPLFADDAGLADRLFRALVSRVKPGEPVQLDIPATNPSALELVQSHGMRPVFETARMYAGRAPELPLHRLFGITTFELG